MTKEKTFAEPARKVARAPVVERPLASVGQGAEPVRVARMAMTAAGELSGGASRATGGDRMDLGSGSQARAGSMRALQRTMGSARVSRALAADVPPASVVRRACACGGEGGSGGSCPECESELSALRRSPAEPGGPAVAPPVVNQVLSSGSGRPLDRSTRDALEPALGRDLGDVTVHTGPQAARAAQSVNARAFTVGSQMVFNEGEYQPGTTDGRKLIAHEATHAVQQQRVARAVATAPLRVGRTDDLAEREAEAVANRTAAESSAGVAPASPAAGPRVQRSLLDDLEEGISSAAETVDEAATSAGAAIVQEVTAAGEAVVSAGETVVQGVTAAGQAVVEGVTAAGQAVASAGGAALSWLATTAGKVALRAARALVGRFGGRIDLTPTGLVTKLPKVPLFPTLQKTLAETPTAGIFVPLLEGGIVEPIPVAGVVGILGTVQGSVEAAVGPGELRNIQITVEPLSNHYAATGQLYVAATVGPRLTLFGGLGAGVGTVLPFEPPVPVIVTIQGGLRGTGTGWYIGALQDTVTLDYSGGTLTFDNVTDLMGGVLLQGDVDVFGALHLYDQTICKYTHPLGHWETGEAWKLTIPIHAGLGDSGGTGGVGPITFGPMPVKDIETAIHALPSGWDCLSWEEIKRLLCDAGILPLFLCLSGPSVLRKQLALAICKCVGDAKCGGGKINKKCFTVADNVCKNKGALQKAADDLCNHDPDMVAACDRNAGCRYRHTDAKCPVKEDECPSGGALR